MLGKKTSCQKVTLRDLVEANVFAVACCTNSYDLLQTILRRACIVCGSL